MFTFFMLPFVWLITLIYGLEVSRRVAVHLLLSVATTWFAFVVAWVLQINKWTGNCMDLKVCTSIVQLVLIAFLIFFVADMYKEKQRRKTIFFLYLLCGGGLWLDFAVFGFLLFYGSPCV